MELYGVERGADYNDIVKSLTAKLKDSNKIIPVGLIFGRPYYKAIKDGILDRIDYYHYRSGDFIELYCIGFYKPMGDFFPIPDEFLDKNGFDEQSFVSTIEEFESLTNWRHSGETDFILINSYFNPVKKQACLDFTTVISITLERTIEEGLYKSIPDFFEKLILFSKVYQGYNPTYEIKNKLALRNASGIIKRLLFDLIPFNMGSNIEKLSKIANYYVKDISKEEIDYLARNTQLSELKELKKTLKPDVYKQLKDKLSELLDE